MHKIVRIYLQNLRNMLLSKHEMDTTSKSKIVMAKTKRVRGVYMEKQNQDKMDILKDYASLQDRVYMVLREKILSGELPPNASLNTNQLSKQMNVSRTPVRDAVNKLVSLGLAEKTVHKEARVVDFMSDEMYEIFCARSALEGIAARSSARYMSEEDKEQLKGIANRLEKSYLTGNDSTFMEMDQELHFLIYDNLKTTVLRDMAKQLYIISKRNSDTAYHHINGRNSEVIQEHNELVRAICNGDAEQAERIGSNHHLNTISNLQKKFEMLKKEIY